MAFRIEYSADAEKHLHQLMARQQATVLDQIVINLAHQPTVETRNRKRMRPNPLAPWELRVGDLRVYYDVKEEPEPVVYIIAVGVKHGIGYGLETRRFVYEDFGDYKSHLLTR